MANINQQFLQKVSELPVEVGFYYSSKSLDDALNILSEKYKIENNFLSDLIDEITVNNYKIIGLEERIVREFNLELERAKQLTIDYIGMALLPIDKYIKEVDLSQEIKKRNGDLNKYSTYVELFYSEIEDENFKGVDKIIDIIDKEVDIDEEKRSTFDLFENRIVDILIGGTNDAIAFLNSGLIHILYKEDSFKNELSKVLLNNKVKLTHKKFIVDKVPTKPTVGNWIKAFIKQHGSSMFSNILLSRYMVNSPNVKRLDRDEKMLVQRLLKLYKNVKFFPDSLANIPPEAWEIIPLRKEGSGAEKIDDLKNAINQDKLNNKEVVDLKNHNQGAVEESFQTNQQQKTDVLDLREDDDSFVDNLNNTIGNQNDLEDDKIDNREDILVTEDNSNESNSNQNTINDLKKLANQYPEGSLERMMVEEEIRKLG